MNSTSISVLIIDDEKMVSRMLRGFLEDNGFLVDVAHSGSEGLALLQDEEFDLAIVDMRLPDIDGNDFIMRAHEVRPEMKYLIHTGSVDWHLTEELASIGINDESILYKPVVDMQSICRLIMKKVKHGM